MGGIGINTSGNAASFAREVQPKANLASNSDNILNGVSGKLTKADIQGAIDSKSENIFLAVKTAGTNTVVMHKIDLKDNPDILNKLMAAIDKPGFTLANISFTPANNNSVQNLSNPDAKVTEITDKTQINFIKNDNNNIGKITTNPPSVKIEEGQLNRKTIKEPNDNTLVVLKSFGLVNATPDEIKASLKSQKESLNNERNPLESKQDKLENQIEKLQKQIKDAGKLTNETRAEMAGLRSELKTVKAEIATIDKKLNKIETTLNTIAEKGSMKAGDPLPPEHLLDSRDKMFAALDIPKIGEKATILDKAGKPTVITVSSNEDRLQALKTKLMDSATFRNPETGKYGGDPISKNNAESIIDIFRDAEAHNVGGPTTESMKKIETNNTGIIIDRIPVKLSSADIKAAVENYDKTEIPRLKQEIADLKANPNTPASVIQEKEAAMGKIENRFNHLQNVDRKAYIAPDPNPDVKEKSAVNTINGVKYTLPDVVKADLKDIVDKFKGKPDELFAAIQKKFGGEPGFSLTKEDAAKILKYGTEGCTTKKEVGDLQDSLAKIGGGFTDLLKENGTNAGHDGKYGFATTKEVRFLSYALTDDKYSTKENKTPVTTTDVSYVADQTQLQQQNPAIISFDSETSSEKITNLIDKAKKSLTIQGPMGNGLHKGDRGSTACPVF
jgi:chaperonin cofactor prefoldin